MEIKIQISITNEQTGSEVEPKITIIREGKAPQTPTPSTQAQEAQFTPLTAFYPPVEGEHGNKGNTNAAKSYQAGRKTHTCSRCGAPNRRLRSCGTCKTCVDWSDEEASLTKQYATADAWLSREV